MKRLALQRRGEDESTPWEVPPIVHEVLRSPGQALDAAAKDFFRSRFGHDFGHVRVHNTPEAAKSAEAVDATAYTVGNHVVFSAGNYAPGTTAGTKLLAHELAHVVQQGGATAQPGDKLHIGSRTDPAEREADYAARSVFQAPEFPSLNLTPAHRDSVRLWRQVAPRKFTRYDEAIRKEIERKPKADTEAVSAWKQRLRSLFESTTSTEARVLHQRLNPGPKGDAFARFFHNRLEEGFRDELLGILVRRMSGRRRTVEETIEEPKCRVDVRATHAGWTARLVGAKHLFIVHADERGSETAYRAGPNLSGLLDEDHGKYDETFPDWDPAAPSVTVLSGKAACGKDMCLVAEFMRIAKAQVPYGLEEPNSNTVASAVLSACGIPRRKPDVWAPGWDGTLDLKPPPAHPGPKTPVPLPWMLL